MTYYRAGHPGQSQALSGARSVGNGISLEDEPVAVLGMTFGGDSGDGYSLTGLLAALLRIKSQKIEGPAALLNRRIPGDWWFAQGLLRNRRSSSSKRSCGTICCCQCDCSFREVERMGLAWQAGAYLHKPLPGRHPNQG